MQLREIVIPEDVKLIDLSTGKPVMKADSAGAIIGEADLATFQSFLLGRIVRDPRFNKDSDGSADSLGIFWAYDMWQAFKNGLRPGGKLHVEEACHARILVVLDKPTSPYDAGIFCQCSKFFSAIRDAAKVEGEVKPKTAASTAATPTAAPAPAAA